MHTFTCQSRKTVRASLNLPVVPQGVNVGLLPTNSKSVVWYYRLRFSGMQLTIETGDLLKTVTREEDGKNSRHVVATALKPSQSSYCCPVLSGHPCIDRAFVAVHVDREEKCLVLTHEKVDTDFNTACKALNCAAKLLSEKWGFGNVLSIVNVFGASGEARAQSSLMFPHVLVRNKDKLRDFCSVNFVDLIWYAREEQMLKNSATAAMHDTLE